ncbi:MAG: linked oxidase domain protein [Verrucomicrobiales bacterium]|nr:linked oxidase domain protein [Verrucomicrobiales bacterium]
MNKSFSGAITQLRRVLSPADLDTSEKTRVAHSGDKWFASHMPDAVAFPRTVEAVSKILAIANRRGLPVTARGAGFGYVGSAVPEKGGLALSLIKMNRILEINPDDFVAIVQPGVITADLQNKVEKLGRYYPPDPASRADCSIGGNIATNAGGPRCLKYGVTREYVLGLQVVLADGTVVRTGGRTHKNKTGFDLTKLFIGSEGMLGIITEATLKLLPLPPYRACLGVGFGSMKQATGAIRDLFSAGILPSALELADEFTLAAARKRTGSRLLEGCRAHFIVELDGQEKSVRAELPSLQKIISKSRPVFVTRALGSQESEKIWQLRREFSYSLRDTGLTKLNEDIVVPRSKLEALFAFTAKLQKKHGLQVACFGHAGDGNIHVNLMVDMNVPGTSERCEEALDDLFNGILDLGGAITGEHGIGLAKKRWWPLAVSKEGRQLHALVKNALDPMGILNPGKFL